MVSVILGSGLRFIIFCMQKNLPIRLTLRKIQSQANLKISLIVKSTLKVVRISNPRTIKNGVAKFYGESISLPNGIGSFQFIILDGQNDACLAKLLVPREIVRQFSTRKNAFFSEASGFKLSWQAEYSSDNDDKNVNNTDRDLNDLQGTPQKGRTFVQPAENVRRRRMETRNADTISQPGQFHRQSIQGFSSATKIRNMRGSINEMDLAVDRINKPLFPIQQRELTSKKSTSKSRSKQKPTTTENSTSKKNKLTKILSQNQFHINQNTQNEQKAIPHKKLQRHRSGFLQRFGVKEVVYTGIIGIVTGLAAAHY